MRALQVASWAPTGGRGWNCFCPVLPIVVVGATAREQHLHACHGARAPELVVGVARGARRKAQGGRVQAWQRLPAALCAIRRTLSIELRHTRGL